MYANVTLPSDWGVRRWEWTTSDLQPWPGFVPMIYRDYSSPFFGGDYRVLLSLYQDGNAWFCQSDPAFGTSYTFRVE